MKIFSLDNFAISGCLFLMLLPQFLSGQSKVITAQTPLHLQLEKTYFMAGDTADYVLQTAKDHDAWYLIGLYESTDTSQAAAIYGEIRYGKSAGSLILPEQLAEGVYWLLTQVEGINKEGFAPVYVFGRPKEIEPEAQPPFQLSVETDQDRLFAGTTNLVRYDLWPRPVLSDGRLIVRNQKGTILADTVLAASGKGFVEVSPDAGDRLQMEVWMNEERMISTLLPKVAPVALDWQLTEESLALQPYTNDSIGALKVSISGPEGFRLEEPVEAGEIHHFSYASWPSGAYTLRLLLDNESMLEEGFSLRTKEPALHLQQHEIPLNTQLRVQARVEGIQNIQDARLQLRVFSTEQQVQLFSLGEGAGGKERSAVQELSVERPASVPAPILNPERLEGTVRDSDGNPAPGAVVSLSGKDLGRMFYTISDESGNFVFDNLPLTAGERYLAAFERENHTFLHADAAFPAAPVSLPSYTLDSAELVKAGAYAQKHFLLNLLQDKEEQEEKEKEGPVTKAIELQVSRDWISTFNAGDYIEFPSLAEFAREAIPGLRVRYQDGKSYMQVLNIVNSRKKVYYKGEPLYLLNGYPVSSADSLLSLDMAAVDRVELVRNNASFDYGRLAQYGIVAVYTHENQVAAHLPREGSWLPLMRQSGRAADFSASPRQNNSLPDFREVISWTSVGKVEPDGSFSFVLNSSDEPGEFMVELTVYQKDNRLLKLTHPLKVTGPNVP